MKKSNTRILFKQPRLPRRPGEVVAGALMALAFSTGPALASSLPASHTAAPSWLSWNAGTHTASLMLIASYNNALHGYNYDGAGDGKMTVTVPMGAKVKVTFTNKNAALTHSFVITPYAKRTSTGGYPVAFKGASSPSPTTGTAKGTTIHASFTASKVGKYAIVCAVPGHVVSGMWDVFTVVKGGAAKISFK